MQPDTPLIDFFHRVYAPLKLAGHRSQAERCQHAIEALTASLGRPATLGDLVAWDHPPQDLATLRTYLIELEVQPTAPKLTYRRVVYHGKEVLVPRGEPSPQEIEDRAAVIREAWDEGETRVRAGLLRHVDSSWVPPRAITAVREE